ncbi:Methyl-CpG-binding domain-containing protein [Actinidia chinensis var. chinensis]|uniref:Methyl-CpG-binding domain-containing protein n=1 Tax=Actinidia chinensis var. chinensis TaxID=1590841 RepID=A0A2R6Q3Y5_ACTCC|nr:Methyl-CpG-binding domain-containing protein [Actinidia chinensis var. chinensis]
MQSRPLKITFKFKVRKEENGLNGSTLPDHQENSLQQPVDAVSSEMEEDHSADDEDNQSSEDAQKQLVVYDPAANGTGEIEPVPDLNECQPPPFLRNSFPHHSSRVLPSVGAFTVQCANCFKWRFIPTKEKYEEIREHILEQPFMCETAREWRPEISCEDPPDICQDGSRLWAIDKPSIAQPPPGWQRLLRIRGEGSTKFADVYYVAPSGKRLRSMVEVQRYLLEHPEYIEEGVTMSQFSFQIPRPLQENYVRKRPARITASDGTDMGMPGLLEPSAVNPLSWAGPDENTDLRLGLPGLSSPLPDSEPAKKKARRKTPSKQNCTSNSVYDEHGVKVEEPYWPTNCVPDF